MQRGLKGFMEGEAYLEIRVNSSNRRGQISALSSCDSSAGIVHPRTLLTILDSVLLSILQFFSRNVHSE